MKLSVLVSVATSLTSGDYFWNQKYFELCGYYEEHQSFIVEGKNSHELQQWVNTQRSLNKRGLLKSDRKQALTLILFDWDAQQGEWEDYYRLVIAFKELVGHTEIPNRFLVNKKLGGWVKRQRHYYKTGTMSQEKINKLNEIDFCWIVSDDRKYKPLHLRGPKDGKERND